MQFFAMHLLLMGFAAAAEVTPVEKVVQMLADLQAQVEEEGKAEATTYDKFACFCKSKTDEKSTAITEGETAVSQTVADLGTYQSDRNTLDGEIDQLNTDIATYQGELKTGAEMRDSEKATFEAAFTDMSKAISALERAIETLKASGSSLVEVKSMVRKSLLMADALEIAMDKKVVTMLLQSEQPVSDYDFHSGDIISTLEGLLNTFRTKKSELESDNASAQSAFNLAAQAKTSQTKAAQVSLDAAEKERAQKTEAIAVAQADLTEANAVLNDDRVYLKDLTSKCEIKAKQWDQRTSMRAGELAAITQALAVIQGVVATKAAETGVGGRDDMGSKGIQDKTPGRVGDFVQTSFVQVAIRRAQDVEDPMVREQLVAMLSEKAKQLHSPALLSLAAAAKADVFAKVKTMIQTLIERLLAEEADEGDHKGWCDEEIAKTVKDRDYRLRDITSLHEEIESLEARKGKLLESELELTEQLATLRSDLANETADRSEEKAENEQTIKDSGEGVDAVQQAIDILAHFYGEAAKGGTYDKFIQQSPDEEAPDAGFGGNYSGSQSASTGILGMLDVIKSDFERTITETTADEEQAKRDFVEFSRETQTSIGVKDTALTNTQGELSSVNDAIGEADGNLRTQQDLFDTAVKTWVELIPQCVADPGMSYEERVQRRNDEIAALKDAYCILNNEDAGCSGVFLQGFLQKH